MTRKKFLLKGPSAKCSQPFYPNSGGNRFGQSAWITYLLRLCWLWDEIFDSSCRRHLSSLCNRIREISIERRNGGHYGALFEVKSCRNLCGNLRPCYVADCLNCPIFVICEFSCVRVWDMICVPVCICFHVYVCVCLLLSVNNFRI